MSTFQERQAVFDSLVRKFPNKPLADTAMDEILQLRAANEALAAMVEQMRVAVAKCRFDSLNMTFADLDYIKRAFAATDFTAASILAERDARRDLGYVEQIKSLQSEVDALKRKKFARFNDDECWIYQGDGEDHFESLVCPVVISVAQLAERDARTLRMAAERCAELGARFYEHARAPYADCALLLLAMADELAKAGATEKKP